MLKKYYVGMLSFQVEVFKSIFFLLYIKKNIYIYIYISFLVMRKKHIKKIISTRFCQITRVTIQPSFTRFSLISVIYFIRIGSAIRSNVSSPSKFNNFTKEWRYRFTPIQSGNINWIRENTILPITFNLLNYNLQSLPGRVILNNL
jgi:hypothetical protein